MKAITIILLLWSPSFLWAQKRVFMTDFGKVEGNVKSASTFKAKTVDSLRYFFVDGNEFTSLEGKCLGDVLHGEVTYYNKKGDPIANGKFNNGLKNGRWLHWDNNGKIREIVNWRKGLKNGSYKRVYDLDKSEEGQWKKNAKIGVWRYTEGGKEVSSVDFSRKKKTKRKKRKFEPIEFQESPVELEKKQSSEEEKTDEKRKK